MAQKYFEKPTQVKFFDPSSEYDWEYGIAYEDKIICGCCGRIFEISDVLEDGKAFGIEEAIISNIIWFNLSDEIKGK